MSGESQNTANTNEVPVPGSRPRMDFSVRNAAQTHAYLDSTLHFTTAEIVAEMNRSPIGQAIVDAANQDIIDIDWLAFHYDPTLKGYHVGGRGVTVIENNVEFSSPGVVDTASTLREIGNTAVHEGLHALGIGGSWEAELWVRRLTFEHDIGRVPTPIEVTVMEADMRAAGPIYTSLPQRVGRSVTLGGRTINFLMRAR